MLDEENLRKGKRPVAENGQQVLQDLLENVAAAVGEGKGDEADEKAPEEAGDGDEVLSEKLEAERARVDIASTVGHCIKSAHVAIYQGG